MNETVSLVIEQLKQAGAAMAPYAEEAWEIYVLQQVIEGVYMTALTIPSVLWIWFTCKRMEAWCPDQPEKGIPAAFIAVFGLMLVLGTLLEQYPLRIFNPEYYAIRELLRAAQ